MSAAGPKKDLPEDLFDTANKLWNHTSAAIRLIEEAMQGARPEPRVPSRLQRDAALLDRFTHPAPTEPTTGPDPDFDDGEGNAAPAAPNASLGPRRPCRVCGDLSLFAIHPQCADKEIAKERAQMDRDDGSEGPAGGCPEEES